MCWGTRSAMRHLVASICDKHMSTPTFTKMREFLANRWGQREGRTMSNRVELLVHLAYDDEADVWYVAKSDIPGLSLEAATPGELLNRVTDAVPQLLELNDGILAKVVRARLEVQEPHRRNAARRPFSVRPVFDNPLQLAHA